MNLIDLVGTLRLQAGDFVAGARSAQSAFTSLGSSIAATAQGIVRSASDALDRIGAASAGMTLAGGALTMGLTYPLKQLGDQAMSMGAQLQGAEIGFTTMLGSGERAKAFLDDLKEFAAGTPFEFKDLVTGAKRVMALGFAADEVIPTMTALGNAAAGLGGGAELIDRLALALGQMKAKGKVSAEEMRQLAEAGIPAWEMLAKAIGVSVPEAMDLAQKGALSASQALPAILAGMQAKFGGLMEGYMSTAMGQWSNLKDQIGFVLADIGKSLLPLASTLISNFAIPVAEALRKVAAGFAALPEPMKLLVIGMAALVAAVGPLLATLGGLAFSITQVGAALGATGLAASLGAILPILGGVAVAIAAVAAAWQLWKIEPIQNAVKSIWETLEGFWSGTLKPLGESLLNLAQNWARLASALGAAGLAALWNDLQAAGQLLWKSLTDVWSALTSVGQEFSEFMGLLAPVGTSIQKLVTVVAEFVAILGVGGLHFALTTATTLFKSFWAVASDVATFMGAVLGVAFKSVFSVLSDVGTVVSWVANQALKMLSEQARAVGWVFENVFNPALSLVVSGLETFLGWIAKIPGVKQALDAAKIGFDALREGAAAAFKTAGEGMEGLSTAQVRALDAAKKSLDDAKKSYDEILSKFQAGKSTQDEVAKAYDAMTAAQKRLNEEGQKVGVTVAAAKANYEAATEALSRARAELEKVQEAYKKNNATGAEYAAALAKVRDATKLQEEAHTQAKTAAKLYGVDLSTITIKQTEAAKTTKQLKEEAKAEAKAWEVSSRAYQDYAKFRGEELRKLEESRSRIEQVRLAYQNFSDFLQYGAGPAIQRIRDRFNEAKQNYDLVLDSFRRGESTQVRLVVASDALYNAQKRLSDGSVEALASYEEYFNRVKESIDALVSRQLPNVTAAMQKVLDQIQGPAMRAINALREAYEFFGIEASGSLQDYADKAQKHYETIRDSGIATAREEAEAWIKAIEARKKALIAAGGVWTVENEKQLKAAKDALDKMDGAVKKSSERQKSTWREMGQQVSTILTDLGRDISKGLWGMITGDSATKKANEANLKQQEDLQKSLDERARAWSEYQAKHWATLEALQKDYGRSLETEEEQHSRSIAAIRVEFEEDLEEKRRGYYDYVEDVQKKLGELREDNARDLAEDLDDLRDALDDRRSAYEDFVDDVKIKLRDLRESYEEDIDDKKQTSGRKVVDEKTEFSRESADRKRRIAEKQRDLDREVADLQAKIDKERAKGKAANQEDVAEWELAIQRKREDYDSFIEDLNIEQQRAAEDHALWLERETADLAEEIDERTKEYQKDEEALSLSLARRAEEWEAFQAENAASEQKAIEEHAASLAAEEAALEQSLAERHADLQAYEETRAEEYRKAIEADIAAHAAMTARLTEEYDQRVADLSAALDEQKAEYDKFVVDSGEKLAELRESFKTTWDIVKEGFLGMLTSMGEAFTRVLIENYIKKGLEKLNGIFPSLGDIFGGGGDGGGGGAGAGGGGGGGLGGLLGGAASGPLGWANIAATVGMGFMQMLSQRAMGMDAQRTEENTRWCKIDLHEMRNVFENDLVPLIHRFWEWWDPAIQELPKLRIDMNDRLYEIRSDLKRMDLSSAIQAATDIGAGSPPPSLASSAATVAGNLKREIKVMIQGGSARDQEFAAMVVEQVVQQLAPVF